MTARIILFLLLVALAAGCEDSIVKPLGPENNEMVINLTNEFRYQAWDLDNVHDRREYTWFNTGTRASVHHRNFVHHGQVVMMVRDAIGKVVDSIPMEYNLDTETDAGAPGAWKVDLFFYGARGRVDVGLVRLP